MNQEGQQQKSSPQLREPLLSLSEMSAGMASSLGTEQQIPELDPPQE